MPFLSTAEALFWDNVSWNSALAPYRAKSKRKGIGWYMKPDEVIKRLAELGITIDRRTLSRYVKWKLVTPPEYRSGGKGVGPIVDYPEHAVAEAAAAAYFLREKRAKKEDVAEARKVAQMLKAHGISLQEIEKRCDLEGSIGVNLIRILEARTWQLVFERYNELINGKPS